MALVTSNDGSKVVGRIGDVVYVPYKGGTYIRKAPKTRKKASTPAMLLNQQRFAFMQKFCVQFKKTLIREIWNYTAIYNNGYSLFMRSNSQAFAKDGSIIDPLLFLLSDGCIGLPKGMIAHRIMPDSNTIEVSWEKDNEIDYFGLIEELMVISYDGLKFSPMTFTGLYRKDLQGTFELPSLPVAAEYVYLFFRSDNRRDFSDSMGFKI